MKEGSCGILLASGDLRLVLGGHGGFTKGLTAPAELSMEHRVAQTEDGSPARSLKGMGVRTSKDTPT